MDEKELMQSDAIDLHNIAKTIAQSKLGENHDY